MSSMHLKSPDLKQIQETTTMDYLKDNSRRSDAEAGQRWAFPMGKSSFSQFLCCSLLTDRFGYARSRALNLTKIALVRFMLLIAQTPRRKLYDRFQKINRYWP